MARKSWWRSIGDIWSASWASAAGFFGIGGYAATDPRRKILPYGQRPSSATANELLTASLPTLRAYCRHLERNNPTARAAVEALVANIVGTGIALEPDTGDETTDKRIRTAWIEYQRDCSVNGHDLYYLQGQALREVVTAGEFLWRLVVLPERSDSGAIPLAVLALEPEWLDSNSVSADLTGADGLTWVGGVGVDKYGRPIQYRLRSPSVGVVGETESVAAKEVIHEFERRRSLQARGEPWFAPIVETLQQERDLIDAELKSAVNTSAMAMVITAESHDTLDTTVYGTTDDPAQTIRLGGVARLYPGESIQSLSHTRPSQQIAPFRQMLRGDIAACMRIPQRFLDRDVSRANYSANRTDNLDTNLLLGPTREWFGHATAGRLYQAVLPYLALKAGVRTPRSNYRLIPDGQPYVDPQKDVAASIAAISAGLSTWEREIGRRGEDALKLKEQLAKELEDPLLARIFDAQLQDKTPAAPTQPQGVANG